MVPHLRKRGEAPPPSLRLITADTGFLRLAVPYACPQSVGVILIAILGGIVVGMLGVACLAQRFLDASRGYVVLAVDALGVDLEVSVRTIERDLDALRQSGVPVWSEAGRCGGYGLDRDRTLPPLALTPAEALAITVTLRAAGESPFAEAAQSAALKLLGSLPPQVRQREEALAAAIYRVA